MARMLPLRPDSPAAATFGTHRLVLGQVGALRVTSRMRGIADRSRIHASFTGNMELRGACKNAAIVEFGALR